MQQYLWALTENVTEKEKVNLIVQWNTSLNHAETIDILYPIHF